MPYGTSEVVLKSGKGTWLMPGKFGVRVAGVFLKNSAVLRSWFGYLWGTAKGGIALCHVELGAMGAREYAHYLYAGLTSTLPPNRDAGASKGGWAASQNASPVSLTWSPPSAVLTWMRPAAPAADRSEGALEARRLPDGPVPLPPREPTQ